MHRYFCTKTSFLYKNLSFLTRCATLSIRFFDERMVFEDSGDREEAG